MHATDIRCAEKLGVNSPHFLPSTSDGASGELTWTQDRQFQKLLLAPTPGTASHMPKAAWGNQACA
jgi:hypothetical protein